MAGAVVEGVVESTSEAEAVGGGAVESMRELARVGECAQVGLVRLISAEVPRPAPL